MKDSIVLLTLFALGLFVACLFLSGMVVSAGKRIDALEHRLDAVEQATRSTMEYQLPERLMQLEMKQRQ